MYSNKLILTFDNVILLLRIIEKKNNRINTYCDIMLSAELLLYCFHKEPRKQLVIYFWGQINLTTYGSIGMNSGKNIFELLQYQSIMY